MTSRNLTDRRLPAEWEPSTGILISWPHADTDWAYMLDEITRCYVELAEAITRHHTLVVVAPDIEVPRRALARQSSRHIIYHQVPTNDTWTRDFGPITVIDGNGRPTLVDFCFNGWGLKFAANHDNLVTRSLVTEGVLDADYENRLGFVLEGGSIESDGKGTVMTTSECLLSPNRNGDLSREEIEAYLCESLGAKRILWIDHGHLAGDDTDSHVDTLARMAPHDTIIYVKCDDPSDPHYDDLAAMERDIMELRTSEGMPYNLVALPMAPAAYDPDDDTRLPSTYANYLVTDRAVFMPAYGDERLDRLAAMIVESVFTGHDVIQVDCRPLIRQHGSLHCATMQLLTKL